MSKLQSHSYKLDECAGTAGPQTWLNLAELLLQCNVMSSGNTMCWQIERTVVQVEHLLIQPSESYSTVSLKNDMVVKSFHIGLQIAVQCFASKKPILYISL